MKEAKMQALLNLLLITAMFGPVALGFIFG